MSHLVIDTGVHARHTSKNSRAERRDVFHQKANVALKESDGRTEAQSKNLEARLEDVRKRQVAYRCNEKMSSMQTENEEPEVDIGVTQAHTDRHEACNSSKDVLV